MSWLRRFYIANVNIQLDSDSDVCLEDMGKFIGLYEESEAEECDLIFSVRKIGNVYKLVFTEQEKETTKLLWQSVDEREVSAALEMHLYSEVVQCLYPQVISIHAAVLKLNGSACMFAGVSGAGKSSICTAGLLAGAPYLSDEFALLDEKGLVYPFPRPMQWEHPIHPAFDRDKIKKTGLITDGYFDFPDVSGNDTRCHLWYPQKIQRNPLPLKAIVLHQFQAELDQSQMFEIPRHEALLELPQHLHIQQSMAKDLPLLNKRIDKNCRFYRLYFPDVHQAWELVEKEIDGVVKVTV